MNHGTFYLDVWYMIRVHHGRDRMVVGFTMYSVISVYVSITTKVARSNPSHREMYMIQHYVINFFSDLL